MIFEMHHFFENIWIFVKLLFIGSLNFNCASPWIMNKTIINKLYLFKKIKHQNYSASNLTPTTSNFVKYFFCKSLHWYVIVYTCWKFTNNQNVANRNYFVIFPFSKPDPCSFTICIYSVLVLVPRAEIFHFEKKAVFCLWPWHKDMNWVNVHVKTT